jgi:hypothetical protein
MASGAAVGGTERETYMRLNIVFMGWAYSVDLIQEAHETLLFRAKAWGGELGAGG